MKFAIAALVLSFCSASFASGPSYRNFEVEIKGTSKQTTDIKACEVAKEVAIKEAYNEISSNCDSDVAYSRCDCDGLKTGEYLCAYSGAFKCVEEVWYP